MVLVLLVVVTNKDVNEATTTAVVRYNFSFEVCSSYIKCW